MIYLPNRRKAFRSSGGGDGGNDSYTKLLLHMDGIDNGTTFTDDSASNHTVTPIGSTKTEDTEKKFGATSGYFDGDGDCLTVPDSEDWDLILDTSTSYTFDFWVKFASTPSGQHALFSFYEDTGNFWVVNRLDTGLDFFSRIGGGAGDPEYNHNWNVNINDTNWHHIALVKVGNTLSLYLDGTKGTDLTIVLTASFNALLKLAQSNSAWGVDFQGYIDEFRVSKGIARWTENFTPPVVPYS